MKNNTHKHPRRDLLMIFSPLLPLTWFPLGHNLFLVTQFVYIQELSHQRLPNSEHTLLPKLVLFTPNYWNLKKEQLNIALPHTRTNTYTGKNAVCYCCNTLSIDIRFAQVRDRASTRFWHFHCWQRLPRECGNERARSQVDSFSRVKTFCFCLIERTGMFSALDGSLLVWRTSREGGICAARERTRKTENKRVMCERKQCRLASRVRVSAWQGAIMAMGGIILWGAWLVSWERCTENLVW